MKDYFSIIEGFDQIKVLVIGDIMLDRYWWGNVSRISPEAPVPVVNLSKTSLVAGGAANVAANIKGLGAQPILFGVVGTDEESKLFKNVLEDLGISPDNLQFVQDRPTTIKTRIVAHNQHVVRIDQENSTDFDNIVYEKMLESISQIISEVDVIILSDYAKGLLTDTFTTRLITIGRENGKSLFIDPKGKNYRKYNGATIITPNQMEALQATNLDETIENFVELAGEKLLEENDLSSILITRGENGMSLYRKNEKSVHFKASARKVYDVTGAGDTVIATLATAYGASDDLVVSAELANTAAGIVVEEVGTTIITKQKLINYLSEHL